MIAFSLENPLSIPFSDAYLNPKEEIVEMG
jgi:hypothetical protein